MKPTRFFAAASLLLAAGACQQASAQTAAPRPGEVQQRLDTQQNRIAAGIKSGQMTPAEVAGVEAHDARIAASRTHDKEMHGGHLTAAEKRNLNERLNANSARIYRKKHNNLRMPQ
jgi:hypothetical protein